MFGLYSGVAYHTFLSLPPSSSFPVSLQADDLDVELEHAAHYMLFAAAAYGWPYYIYTNPFTALCKLNGDW